MKLIQQEGVWVYREEPHVVPVAPYETDDEDELPAPAAPDAPVAAPDAAPDAPAVAPDAPAAAPDALAAAPAVSQPSDAGQHSGGGSDTAYIPPPWYISDLAQQESRIKGWVREAVREELQHYFGSRMSGPSEFPPPGP